MPPKATSKQVDMSDLEDDLLNSELEVEEQQPAQPVINRTVIKKTAAAAAATKPRATAATKAATATKKAAPRTTTTAAKAKETKAQKEQRANATHDNEEGETDDIEESTIVDVAPAKPKTKRARVTKAREEEEEAEADQGAPPPKKTARATKTKAAAASKDEIPDSQAPAKVRKARTTKRAPSPPRVPAVRETQQQVKDDVEQSIEHVEQQEDEMEVDGGASPQPPPVKPVQRARSSSQQRPQQPVALHIPRARSTSVQPRNFSRSRQGSVSDSERRVAESDAKRRLHEMTRKYEDMRIKYDSLQELAQNAAESNFEKLKKATDEKTKDANAVIASLKRQVNQLRNTSSAAATESARLQSQVALLQSENEKLKEDAKASAATLSETQNEVKSLTAKLDAARKSVQAASAAPGSTTKGNSRDAISNTRGGGGGGMSTGSTPEAAKQAALKEELYRDLTGLIINSVKRKDGEDEYSCIQTGRNGTLLFHLTISNDSNGPVTNPKTPSGLSYEETEFAYEPLLDEKRDRDLIDILPDYLTEEICFPRNHAVKFYTKVVESMTRRVVVEEEEGEGEEEEG